MKGTNILNPCPRVKVIFKTEIILLNKGVDQPLTIYINH